MKESVSCLFIYEDKLYLVKRRNNLKVFPGYHAPPGGKVDEDDPEKDIGIKIPDTENSKIISTLFREVLEEIGFSIENGIASGIVKSVSYAGIAITPEYNPYRFKNHYFKVHLNQRVDFDEVNEEADYGEWKKPSEFLDDHRFGRTLLVPAAVRLLEFLKDNIRNEEFCDMNFTTQFNSLEHIPMIEPIGGILQFLPLSNTFPPANRTNSYLIGDDGFRKILIDPSPKDLSELNKFINTLNKYSIDDILITHHHRDHWQFIQEFNKKLNNKRLLMSQYTFDNIDHDNFKGFEIKIIKEGDIVTKYHGVDVIVHEVPGHDEGQIGLSPINNQWFLVGDLIQTVGTVVIGGPEGNMIKYFQSLNRVIELDPKFILPSHGIIIGGTYKLKETLEHRKIRENQIIELLKINKSEEDILDIVYVGLKTELLPYARKTIRAHIEKILEENLV